MASQPTPFDLPSIEPPVFPPRTFDLTDYGARPDGRTSCTAAFGAAVKACADAGGGTVRVGRGDWFTGPIHLRSHVQLRLDAGAVVRFSTRPADYLPVVFTRWEGVECHNYSPLIYARDCTNVAVTGEGTFEGQGQDWWHWKQLQHAAVKTLYHAEHNGIPVDRRVFGTESAAMRPQFIQPINCSNVLIAGVTFLNGPMWTIHPVYCNDVVVQDVTVISEGPNTDGLNPDSCTNVLVERCRFSTGDDCVAINSGMNEDGRRVGRPCANVLVRHCRMERGHGGVVIGSAMSGNVHRVQAHDCTCDGTDCGIRLKSMLGRGGVVEDVWFHDFTMQRITHQAIVVDMFYGASSAPPAGRMPPTFRNIRIQDVTCAGARQAVLLRGLEDPPLRDVTLRNIAISAREPMVCQNVEGLTMQDVAIAVRG